MKYGQFVGAVADLFELQDHEEFFREARILVDPANRDEEFLVGDEMHCSFPSGSVDDEDAARITLLAVATSMRMINPVPWVHELLLEQGNSSIGDMVKAFHHEEEYRMAICFGAVIADICIHAQDMTAIRDLYAPVAAKPAKPVLRAVN